LAFSILNTPKELRRRLMRRVAAQRSSPTASTSSGIRRSPRIATAKSPKGKVG
ncbi:NUMA1 protein, partial [Erpornis zantholeuca]|nr:NUMA1 protein [Erpornis zantholeuca]